MKPEPVYYFVFLRFIKIHRALYRKGCGLEAMAQLCKECWQFGRWLSLNLSYQRIMGRVPLIRLSGAMEVLISGVHNSRT